MPLLRYTPEPNYTVFLETDEQHRDTGEFIMETYHHVKAVVPFDRMLMLDLGEGNLYYYSFDHVRSYRIHSETVEETRTKPDPTLLKLLGADK